MDLSAVHKVEDEAVLLPVDAIDLPRQLILASPLMLLIHCLLHLHRAWKIRLSR